MIKFESELIVINFRKERLLFVLNYKWNYIMQYDDFNGA